MKTKLFLMIAALAIFTLWSCNKEEDIDQNSLELADDDVVSDAIFEDVFNSVDQADVILDHSLKGGDSKSLVPPDSCSVVTIDHPLDANWPKTITVDFGAGCTGTYGAVRKGKIIITVTGPRLEAGSKRTVTFDDYYINEIKVEGTKVIENLGYNEAQHMVFSVTLTDGKLTLHDGKTIERTVSHEREWMAGLLTKNIWDDECRITGVASGVNLKGVSYTNTITAPLYWKRACRFLVSGVVKIEREGKDPLEINYGTGECDAFATISMSGESKEITLKYHR